MLKVNFAFIVVLGLASFVDAQPLQIDPAAIATAGESTQKRLLKSAASWVVDTTLESGATISIDVLQASGDHPDQRLIFRIIKGQQQFEFLRIVMRDGLWYCSERSGQRKYRPYELPTETPFVYLTLNRASPLFLTDKSFIEGGKVESTNDGIATIRQPLDENTAETLRGAMAGFEKMKQQMPKAVTPELERIYAQVRDTLANGLATLVDIASGQVVEYGSIKMRTRVRNLNFLDKADKSEFAVAGKQWEDYSDDPTAGDVNNLLMISHNPLGRPGNEKGDLDGRLMDVKTGRFRRIPFKGGAVMGGCFLSDRKSVVVSGLDGNSGALRPYVIDLKTGENRALGGVDFQQGFALGPDLSPDGKTLVIVKFSPGTMLASQLYLIDVASGNAKPLGKPKDTAFLNWTADGKHIVLVDRKDVGMDKPSQSSLAIMNMEGSVKILRRGNMPVLLADRKTILFEDQESRQWQTCELDGGNVQLFAGGMAGYSFPTVAPDGKRIFMMKFQKGAMPLPVEFQIGQPNGRIVTNEPGLWGTPAWR